MTTESLASRAEVVLDPRLAEIWQLIWTGVAGDETRVTEETLAGLLRLAYLQGFADAKEEAVEGELYRELGLRVPVTETRAVRLPGGRPRRRSSGM
ncbi:MAG: hypothetical protein ACRDJ1_11100 [Actinomycetota bacterium]